MKDFFVSFNSADRVWADWIAWMLEEAGYEVAYQPWDFRPGGNFVLEMQKAASEARKTVVVLSDNYLQAAYTQPEWAAAFVQDPHSNDRKLIPLRVEPCSPPGLLQALIYADLVGLPADEAKAAVLAAVSDDRPKPGQAPAFPGTAPHPAKPAPAYPGLHLHLDIGRLPTPGKYFVGRDAELARLDAAWEDPSTRVLTLVAFGGVGKSALVAHWLERMSLDDWRGATRVLDWSFYSQGSKDQNTSAEPFIDHALRFFSDPDPKAGSLHDRGARLASLIRKERSLLVLDGIEPLQYPPGRPEIEGRLKDPGLTALLKGLAAANPGLCVVTTRVSIADLAGSPRTAPQIPLEELDADSAVQLLQQLGVKGQETELRSAAEDFKRHALTLTLLGNYLCRAHHGDIRKRQEVDLHRADETQGGQAFRVIATYALWLGEGPELSILRLLGLFDRPADAAALQALRAKPPIPGLTEPLFRKKGWWTQEALPEEDWQTAVTTLREHSLVAAADPQAPDILDAHPLVRAYFAEELEINRPAAWQKGNRRLYDHLCRAAPEYPDTLETLQLLYAAVVHGCRAGRQQEAMNRVYQRRILRGNEQFSWRQLGAFGSELTALAGFFDRPWSQPSPRLSKTWRAFVLGAASFHLRALGRLREALEPMQTGLKARIAQEDWQNAAIATGNLSELTLSLGEVPRAVAFGEQSVELADRSGAAFARLSSRVTWADALHQAGRWEESASAFRAAEAIQEKSQARYPRLYSLQGFQYCDLLLDWAEPEDGSGLDGLGAHPEEAKRGQLACQMVLKRAQGALEYGESWYSLADVAFDHLALGRAHLALALHGLSGEDRTSTLAQAAENLSQTVKGLRQAGTEDHLPCGLLARAALRRFRSDFPGAVADLTEALEIAERGPMRLYECDAHLEWARLCRDQGDLAAAREHVARARELVNETGYGRREREVGWLEGTLTP
ncbi:MAG TPA: toll/interleukin-1 receptor domain-containing protein [Thermoanaerobaculia bacterium]|nr:toll/interleukin-1 receptor domain-containing protein [Thermoanaerobaculia bacterium]